ncbi:MAG: hypothetical protein M0D55_20065 [Elusimicrobiota bacterium]|nr:MAG: hypothetical protein M0D55_20065 [Elusimicrobiota bacterium]
MKLSLLGLLACPVCRGDLKFAVLDAYPRHDAEVEEATLACKLCAREYPVRDGVPRLRPPDRVAAATDKTRDAFGWEWLRYPGSLPGDKEVWLEETMLPPHELAGKLVLDAGCGMGRYAAVALSLGAEVVAVDMSESLQRVVELARTQPKLHPVEGTSCTRPSSRPPSTSRTARASSITPPTRAPRLKPSPLCSNRAACCRFGCTARPAASPTSRRTR